VIAAAFAAVSVAYTPSMALLEDISRFVGEVTELRPRHPATPKENFDLAVWKSLNALATWAEGAEARLLALEKTNGTQ
jgi:hypothetical protein